MIDGCRFSVFTTSLRRRDPQRACVIPPTSNNFPEGRSEPLNAVGKTSRESLDELFGQGVRRRVCDLIDVLLHFFPGLSLGFVFSVLQLLDLLDVVTAMCQKKALQCVFRQIRICLAQVRRDFLRV